MSTATQTGFVEASVQKMPSLACIGVVTEVGEGKLSSSGNYVVQPITVRAQGPGRGVVVRPLYRPEWLTAGFDPSSLTEFEGGESFLAVYRRHIAVKNGVSTLKGLAGSEEAYVKLATALLASEDKSESGISQVLRDFFLGENDGTPIGYILKQQKQQAGEDENGKKIYELANGYEVGEFFFVTPENIKKIKNRAARAKDGNLRIAFDEDEY